MVMDNPLARFREFILAPSHSRTISAVVILIIAAAIPFTVLVAQQQQETRQQAQTVTTTTYYPSSYYCASGYGGVTAGSYKNTSTGVCTRGTYTGFYHSPTCTTTAADVGSTVRIQPCTYIYYASSDCSGSNAGYNQCTQVTVRAITTSPSPSTNPSTSPTTSPAPTPTGNPSPTPTATPVGSIGLTVTPYCGIPNTAASGAPPGITVPPPGSVNNANVSSFFFSWTRPSASDYMVLTYTGSDIYLVGTSNSFYAPKPAGSTFPRPDGTNITYVQCPNANQSGTGFACGAVNGSTVNWTMKQCTGTNCSAIKQTFTGSFTAKTCSATATSSPTPTPTGTAGVCPAGQKKGFNVCKNFQITYDNTGACGTDTQAGGIGGYCTSPGTCTNGPDGTDKVQGTTTQWTCNAMVSWWQTYFSNPYPTYDISPAYLPGSQPLTYYGLMYARYLGVKFGPAPRMATGESDSWRACDSTINNSYSLLAWKKYIQDMIAGIAPPYVQSNGYVWTQTDMQRNLDVVNSNIQQIISLYNTRKTAQQEAIAAGDYITYYNLTPPPAGTLFVSLDTCNNFGSPTPTPTPAPTSDCNGNITAVGTCVAQTSDTCSVNNGIQSWKYTTYNGSTVCNPVNINLSCTVNNCNVGNVCTNGNCVAQTTPTPTPTPSTCTNGATQCSSTGIPQTCTNGTWVNGTACTGGLVCNTSTGTCTTCTNGATQCSATGVPQTCTNGTWVNGTACTGGLVCTNGTCVTPTCTNGATQCSATGVPQTCTNGTWIDGNACTGGLVCTNGTCGLIPGHTYIALRVGMDAIGSAGDNVNPNPSSSNQNPQNKTRNLAVQIFNSNNSQVFAQVGSINYNSTSGVFLGTIDLGANFASGNYIVKVKSDGHLRRIIPGIQNLSSGLTQPIQLPGVNLVAGDIDSNNALNIKDYNILLSCVTSPFIANIDNKALCNSNANYVKLSDLEDNGVVNEFDYNLFLREYAVQNGD